MVDYVLGTAYLGEAFYDGGHTAVNYPAVLTLITPGNALNDELNRIVDLEDFRDRQAMNYVMKTLASGQKSRNMAEYRSGKYENYELVKAWDDKSLTRLLTRRFIISNGLLTTQRKTVLSVLLLTCPATQAATRRSLCISWL